MEQTQGGSITSSSSRDRIGGGSAHHRSPISSVPASPAAAAGAAAASLGATGGHLSANIAMYRSRLAKIRLPQFYRDDKLVPSTGIRDEFSQKVIQLGYIAMFACSFPLAPCFALLNNVYEVRTDAFKLLTIYQRPLPARAKDIGIWDVILKFVAHASVLTNSAIIAFNSPAFESAFLGGFGEGDVGSRFAARLTFIIGFHYCVHLLVTGFLIAVPEMPTSVHLAMERAAYLDRVRRGNEVEEEDERLSVSSLELLRRE
ncbi:Anoctamin-3 [Dinochytrium kinnereticum]|nr:Anoctamin-3 [Dinochytrium kinnereticum]